MCRIKACEDDGCYERARRRCLSELLRFEQSWWRIEICSAFDVSEDDAAEAYDYREGMRGSASGLYVLSMVAQGS